MEIPDISGLTSSTVLYTKIGEVEKRIPDLSGLATTVIQKLVKLVINPDVSKLVKKAD